MKLILKNLILRSFTLRELEAKQQLDEIVKLLPESKLKSIIDFDSYLKDREETEGLWAMQLSSQGYLDWLSSENDIYDEVFNLD